ncbi:NUDIX domain-containing protein [Streptomyces demainii]|uniref:ADP-ribose pyrophosphatase YjhB (NUDIX family) n=1 Tax=Streptomyces demainii TaxID=588122 RepID=A0ABT9KKA6_9ACTN|nr:NUDIX hydrolase [Streptomyces demainii]MDP9608863.1 ADP-ribose pyrophosphatase YjhB (NUDIX family) [Streptomyces demainii]
MTENEHEAKMARPRVAAGALFFDEQDQVLLVEPTYKDYREIPGGYVETGESPRQACIREVREELGITPAIGRLLVVDWAPNPAEGDKILYVFDGGTLPTEGRAQIRLQADELSAYGFHPVEDIESLTIPRLARRIRAAAQARATDQTCYLEHGALPQHGD